VQLLEGLAVFALLGGAVDGGSVQIRFERGLPGARALARSEGRPLLGLINADGESGSERVVRERYHDASFVSPADRLVCVVGSVFRHMPRDFDGRGQRIPCPRFGAVTCGEHIGLEPEIHDAYHAGIEIELDGEIVDRISPRHTLVSPEGEVIWDLYLLFDMRELDDALKAAAEAAPPPIPFEAFGWESNLRGLARDRRNEARTYFESMIEGADDQLAWDLTNALLYGGDEGAVPALRMLLVQSPRLAKRIVYVADVLGLEQDLATDARTLVELYPLWLGEGLRTSSTPGWMLAAIGALDREGARTFLLSHEVFPNDRLGPFTAGRPELASAPPPEPERPSAEEYEAELAALEPRVAAGGFASPEEERELRTSFGRALLGLARRRIEAGDGSAGFLLEDADRELARAAELGPADAALLLDLARTSFYRSDFEAQEAYGLRVLALDELDADTRTEAQRWIGDAGARLIGQRATGPEDEERAALGRTAEALRDAALGPESDATDWVSWASFLGATGRPYAQLCIGEEGMWRHPESDDVRGVVTAAVRWLGEPERLVHLYEEQARENPESGACAWYAGWALVNSAEWQRRGEAPDEAIASYERAAAHFERARELEPVFADSAEHYLAMCAMGRGFAHLIADRRGAAAEALLEAIAIRPAVATVRDGLDREALDLVDQSLEWRRSGPSEVDPMDLAERLLELDPGNGFWPRAVADAEFREAGRALGRGELEQGIGYLRASLPVAELAVATEPGEEASKALAQPATTLAEIFCERNRNTAEVEGLLATAARALGRDLPVPGDDLSLFAAALREELGEARPVIRPGR
jgi:tetratricopeptide (TPR) repeat protein